MLHPREWAVELCKSYLVIWTGIDPTNFKTSGHKEVKCYTPGTDNFCKRKEDTCDSLLIHRDWKLVYFRGVVLYSHITPLILRFEASNS